MAKKSPAKMAKKSPAKMMKKSPAKMAKNKEKGKKTVGGQLNPGRAKPSKGSFGLDTSPPIGRAKSTGGGYVKLTSNPPKYRNSKTGKTISEEQYKNLQGKITKTVKNKPKSPYNKK